ncbi:MAG: hypothetical protein R6U65_01150, partial [Perlabentimonas sp.]
MKKSRITNKDLKQIGLSHPDILASVGKESNNLLKKRKFTKPVLLDIIATMINNPIAIDDNNSALKELNTIIRKFLKDNSQAPLKETRKLSIALKNSPLPYPVFGNDYIDKGAIEQ